MNSKKDAVFFIKDSVIQGIFHYTLMLYMEISFSSKNCLWFRVHSFLDFLILIFFYQEILLLSDEQQSVLGNIFVTQAIDFYICTQADVFVPSVSGISYLNIVGHRIANGRKQVLVPVASTDYSSKLKVSQVISKLVKKKNHNAYSCFCGKMKSL